MHQAHPSTVSLYQAVSLLIKQSVYASSSQSMFQVVYVIKQSVCIKQPVSSCLCYQAVHLYKAVYVSSGLRYQAVCLYQAVSLCYQAVRLYQAVSLRYEAVSLCIKQSMFQTVCVSSSLRIKQSVYVSSSQSVLSSQPMYQAVNLRIKQLVYVPSSQSTLSTSQPTYETVSLHYFCRLDTAVLRCYAFPFKATFGRFRVFP